MFFDQARPARDSKNNRHVPPASPPDPAARCRCAERQRRQPLRAPAALPRREWGRTGTFVATLLGLVIATAEQVQAAAPVVAEVKPAAVKPALAKSAPSGKLLDTSTRPALGGPNPALPNKSARQAAGQ